MQLYELYKFFKTFYILSYFSEKSKGKAKKDKFIKKQPAF